MTGAWPPGRATLLRWTWTGGASSSSPLTPGVLWPCCPRGRVPTLQGAQVLGWVSQLMPCASETHRNPVQGTHCQGGVAVGSPGTPLRTSLAVFLTFRAPRGQPQPRSCLQAHFSLELSALCGFSRPLSFLGGHSVPRKLLPPGKQGSIPVPRLACQLSNTPPPLLASPLRLTGLGIKTLPVWSEVKVGNEEMSCGI